MNPELSQEQQQPDRQQQIIELAKGGVTDAELTAEQMDRVLKRGVPFRQFVKELAQTFGRPEEELRQQQQPQPPARVNQFANMNSYNKLHGDMYEARPNKKSWFSENLEWAAPLGVVALFVALTVGFGVCLSTSKTATVTKTSSSPTPEQVTTSSTKSTGIVRTFQSRVRFRNQRDDNPSLVEITAQWQVPANTPTVEQKNIARKIEMTAAAATAVVAVEYMEYEGEAFGRTVRYEFSKQWRKICKLQPSLADCQPIITDVLRIN